MGAAADLDRGPRYVAPTWSLGSRANYKSDGQGGAFCRFESPVRPPNLFSFFDPKAIWRDRLRSLRAEAALKHKDAAKFAAQNFIKNLEILPSTTVGLYHPINDELDTKPLADALWDRGFSISLPVTPSKKGPLTFHQYKAGDRLFKGKFGVMTPDPNSDQNIPTIIVTPLLGFSRSGDRLGYGGGYYDRTLMHNRKNKQVVAVGFAYAAQEVDDLPSDNLDQRLDWIITEREAIKVAAVHK